MQYDTFGRLEVFVILNKEDNTIFGICEDKETTEKQIQVLKKFGNHNEIKFAKYKVMRLRDFD